MGKGGDGSPGLKGEQQMSRARKKKKVCHQKGTRRGRASSVRRDSREGEKEKGKCD